MKKTSHNSLFSSLATGLAGCMLISASFFVAGCQKKQDQPQQGQSQNNQQTPADTAKAPADTQSKPQAQTEPQKTQNVDLKGTWRGKFDQHATTLKITEMDGNNFKGTITINYREVINQQVSGTIDPATRKVTMKDLLHSRFAGKYSGKVSDNMNSLSGTFTMTLDGSKFQFNLAKK